MKKSMLAVVLGLLLIIAGTNHFANPSFYVKIMPPYLPNPELFISLSGVAEIVCGILLTINKTRRIGAWLTILLLIAILPANVQMMVNEYDNRGLLFFIAVLRLPLQGLLIWWAYAISKSSES